MTVLPKDMVPAGLAAIERREDQPDLHDTEIALLSARKQSASAGRLHKHIVHSLEDVGTALSRGGLLDERPVHPI